ncbi:DUF1659 domain-containing protein [Alicyclobacillus dauci]|uniref:DUF1659 domain-containing protein n=1 Tax=Alicyclobacillus dauci TaxID=1475485 RepID=A0ABY6Z312_9BACL|nr:DUF1659 domain-containing protein [Alicyclobacillus dauci]WAH36674.1 DUF1659 domain-containing protein [Alicyclobacillus dauci]
MAQTTPVSRVLQIQLQTGTLANGQPKVTSHNYANVAMDSVDDDLLAVGQAIAALYADPLVQITRQDQVAISANSSTSTT